MFTWSHKRKAISTVLVTMIILVASVVLATGVVLYGTSLFQSKATSETITTTGTQVWLDSTGKSGWAWGAAAVRNAGDKILSVDQILIRGQTVPYANWYVDTNATQVTVSNFQSALVYTSMKISPNSPDGQLTNGTDFNVAWTAPGGCTLGTGNLILKLTSTNPTLCLSQRSGPVSLAPGDRAIIYFKVTQNLLTSLDASGQNTVAFYAGKSGSPVEVTAQAK